MIKSLTITFWVILYSLNSLANLPDSIQIIDKSFRYLESYSYEYILIRKGDYYLTYQIYSSSNEGGKIVTSSKRVRLSNIGAAHIENIINVLYDSNYTTLKLANFGYSKEWLERNQDSLWSYVEVKYKHWTDIQKQFVLSALLREDNYNKALRRTILEEGYIPISRHSGNDFKLTFYYVDKTQDLLASDKLFGFPWKTESHDIFNILVPKLVSKIIPENKSFNKERFKEATNHILDMLVRQIYDDECQFTVEKLAPLSFTKELSELEPHFKIISSKEFRYYGRYIKSDSQTFRITLRNDLMKQSVSMQYFITRNGNTLYPRDSLLKKYKSIIARVQNIKFLMDYLDADTSRKIEICFFDSRAFNDYNIDAFNKNPSEWAKYEEMIRIIPSQSKYINQYCGCNFRLEKRYLEGAIFFELINEFEETSIWVLLPEETPVLWFFEGKNAYKYNYQDYKTKGVSVQHACKKFNPTGGFKE